MPVEYLSHEQTAILSLSQIHIKYLPALGAHLVPVGDEIPYSAQVLYQDPVTRKPVDVFRIDRNVRGASVGNDGKPNVRPGMH